MCHRFWFPTWPSANGPRSFLHVPFQEWSDRGNAVETLTGRVQEEGAWRAEERARLERRVEAAEGEAGARGEELARLVVEFETRAACAEAEMDEKVAASFTVCSRQGWGIVVLLCRFTGERGWLGSCLYGASLDGGDGIGVDVGVHGWCWC